MGRIRTIKPEFFQHEELFDAEMDTCLPIRLAFAGLWCQADREGRFKWKPRALKAQILPFDGCDFSRVLDALTTRGFIQKYACNGEEFGVIPSFLRHQVINNRERDSELPVPPTTDAVATTSTRAPRVEDACPTESQDGKAERKGKEGKGTWKGKEGEGGARALEAPRILPKGLSEHPAVVLYWERFRPQVLPAIRVQEQIEMAIGTDLEGWVVVLDFWQGNSYRPESVGKMLDRYREQQSENDPAETLRKKYAGPEYQPGGRLCPPLGMTQREWDRVWLEKQGATDGETAGSHNEIHH